MFFFFFSSRRRHTRWPRDWSSDVCSSDLEGADHPAHPADVADQRGPRHRHARRADRDRHRRRLAREADWNDCDRLRDDQHRRRLPGHRPDARHVPRSRPQAEAGGRRRNGEALGDRSVTPLAALSPDSDFVTVCYIAAFSLFILGIRQGTHPRTARRGNMLAAAGMLIAIVITLALDVVGNGALILIGILLGTGVGVIASIRVQMTQMPQMVALYNGVGGGAAALIAWSEFRHNAALGEIPLDVF